MDVHAVHAHQSVGAHALSVVRAPPRTDAAVRLRPGQTVADVVRSLSDAHLAAAVDGQLDALSIALAGGAAWGSTDDIKEGLRRLTAEMERRRSKAP